MRIEVFPRLGNVPYRVMRGLLRKEVSDFLFSVEHPELTQRQRFSQIVTFTKGSDFVAIAGKSNDIYYLLNVFGFIS